MVIVYEKRKYVFRDKWLSENGGEISSILSNFLCEKAVKDGADPSLFIGVKTTARTKVFKKKPKIKEVAVLKPSPNMLFDFGKN